MILRNLVVVFFTLSILLQPSQAQPIALPMVTARWINLKHAEIAWKVPGCLQRIPEGTRLVVNLGCYQKPGKMILPGDGPNDFAYFPKEGDTYRLHAANNETFDAVLPHRFTVFTPLVIHLWSFEHHQVWLPVVIAQT